MTNRIAEVEEELVKSLDFAAAMELGLSEDDADYDLQFIASKLAKCSTFLEKLADLQIYLTKISIEVARKADRTAILAKLKEIGLKDSDEFQELERARKSPWLENQLRDLKEEAQRWLQLRRLVLEVKEAVGDRVGTMKRLDSDLRLHTKLLEAKVAAGATARNPMKGDAATGDLDLD